MEVSIIVSLLLSWQKQMLGSDPGINKKLRRQVRNLSIRNRPKTTELNLDHRSGMAAWPACWFVSSSAVE